MRNNRALCATWLLTCCVKRIITHPPLMIYVRKLEPSDSYSRNETSVLPAQVSVRLTWWKSNILTPVNFPYTQMNSSN
jgi:hypothetical protein